MINDEKLLLLNRQGFIPGPDESEEMFLKRVEITKKIYSDPANILKYIDGKTFPKKFFDEKKVKRPLWGWSKKTLKILFDIEPVDFYAFFSNEKLSFFEAAATWIVPIELESTNLDSIIKIPLLQFRKKLKEKNFLLFYNFDEILAHEAAHMARVSFNNSKYEEIFAYLTSASSFRRILGGIINNPKEGHIFLGLCLLSTSCSLFYNSFISIFSWVLPVGYFSIGVFRLLKAKYVLSKAYNNILTVLKDKKKGLCVLFRLSDEEIKSVANLKKNKVETYFRGKIETSFRFRMLNISYFFLK
jgi:hypothetical protein